MIVGHSIFTPIHIQVNQQREKYDFFSVDFLYYPLTIFSIQSVVHFGNNNSDENKHLRL